MFNWVIQLLGHQKYQNFQSEAKVEQVSCYNKKRQKFKTILIRRSSRIENRNKYLMNRNKNLLILYIYEKFQPCQLCSTANSKCFIFSNSLYENSDNKSSSKLTRDFRRGSLCFTQSRFKSRLFGLHIFFAFFRK